ncbi:hypothetical protein SAMN04489740_4372 [Arthrobacter alpinus]|uniref:Uncharacterized protein n=1 Tax=Arthrobacter alpinus TaxID=656366 RepID=A0A1H5P8Q9_9MICC|nr:hypothetical protein SAMN04489740_3980 [Arthrobacter alpinus]SEF13413.1 hypothetical protein SAMN04489740_4372 [Arthrobacter alpinus]
MGKVCLDTYVSLFLGVVLEKKQDCLDLNNYVMMDWWIDRHILAIVWSGGDRVKVRVASWAKFASTLMCRCSLV